MNRILAALLLIAAATLAHGAPAPQTIVVNSQAATAPALSVYRGSESAVRVKFYDGNTATALGSQVPYLSWSSNSLAATLTDASYSVVAGLTGVVDFVWSPADVNFPRGSYFYEVGIRSTNGNPVTVRSGTFTILGSPQGGGAVGTNFAVNINGALYSFSAPWPESSLPASWLTNAAAGSGDITAVLPGAGLSGGGSSGSVTLAVSNAVVAGALLGGTALQAEVDTLATVLARGDVVDRPINMAEESLDWNDSGITPFVQIDPGNLTRWTGSAWQSTLRWYERSLYGSWSLGTSDGSTLTNITASQVGAVGWTNVESTLSGTAGVIADGAAVSNALDALDADSVGALPLTGGTMTGSIVMSGDHAFVGQLWNGEAGIERWGFTNGAWTATPGGLTSINAAVYQENGTNVHLISGTVPWQRSDYFGTNSVMFADGTNEYHFLLVTP